VPRGTGLQQHVDDGLEPGNRRAARVQVLGPRETRQQIGEIRRGRVVADGQVVEARPDRPIEKGPKLPPPNDSKFSPPPPGRWESLDQRVGAPQHRLRDLQTERKRHRTPSRQILAAGCASAASDWRRTLRPSTTAGPIRRTSTWLGWLAGV